ncbi:MAG: tetratricopeptide repeat protein [Acidimicrobiales bacterium]
MAFRHVRKKFVDKYESKITTGKDPEGWLEDMKRFLDKSIARNGIDSKQSRKWRLLVCDQLQGLGRYDEERLLWEAQVKSLRRSKGTEDLETAMAEGRLAQDLRLLGEFDEARVILQHVYGILTEQLDPDDDRTEWVKREIEMIDDEVESDDS